MKFIYNFSYKNNFFIYNKIYNLNLDSDDDNNNYNYYFDFSKKSIFFRKTKKGVKYSTKLYSLKRNKNLSFNNFLINSWVKKGLKLSFLKHYNIFLKNIFFLIKTDKLFFNNYPNTEFVYDLLNSKKYNYKLQNLLTNPLLLLEHMFELKLKKLNKKMKRKFKKKHVYVVKYLYKTKRLKNTLNMFYLSSNFYNNKKYYDRIFYTFLNVIFDTKNTPIFKKKLNVYKIALKFLKKK